MDVIKTFTSKLKMTSSSITVKILLFTNYKKKNKKKIIIMILYRKRI
jgi:hypothetical protein